MEFIILAGCVCPGGGTVGVIEGFDCFYFRQYVDIQYMN